MNTEGTGFYTCKECNTTESLSKHTTIIHKEREQLGDRRNVGESSCNYGDGTGQMAQPLMFMMIMMMMTNDLPRGTSEKIDDFSVKPAKVTAWKMKICLYFFRFISQ